MTKTLSIALTTLVMVVSVTGCKQHDTTTPPAPIRVEVLEIKSGLKDQQLTYSGTIEPENTSMLSFAVPGVIEDIKVEEGQFVRKGEVLARLDDTEYRHALIIASAALTQAEDMYKRLSSLYNNGSLPEKDYMDIQTKVAQATANKEIKAKHIRDSRLVAPFSGIITKKMIERGSAVAPGLPAFQIVKTDKVYAKVSVPESEVGSLAKGMNSNVLVKTLNAEFRGAVSIINPQADPVAKTYEVKIKLDNSPGRLLPGMIADVSINTGKKVNVVTVPSTAIVRDADNVTYVFITNDKSKAVRKRIEVTGITGENQVIVTGLQDGDKVVVAGQSRLKEGTELLASR